MRTYSLAIFTPRKGFNWETTSFLKLVVRRRCARETKMMANKGNPARFRAISGQHYNVITAAPDSIQNTVPLAGTHKEPVILCG